MPDLGRGWAAVCIYRGTVGDVMHIQLLLFFQVVSDVIHSPALVHYHQFWSESHVHSAGNISRTL